MPSPAISSGRCPCSTPDRRARSAAHDRHHRHQQHAQRAERPLLEVALDERVVRVEDALGVGIDLVLAGRPDWRCRRPRPTPVSGYSTSSRARSLQYVRRPAVELNSRPLSRTLSAASTSASGRGDDRQQRVAPRPGEQADRRRCPPPGPSARRARRCRPAAAGRRSATRRLTTATSRCAGARTAPRRWRRSRPGTGRPGRCSRR